MIEHCHWQHQVPSRLTHQKNNKIKICQSLKLMSSRYFVIHISTQNYAHKHLFIHVLNKHLQAAFFFNIKSYRMRNTPKKKKKLNDKRYSIKLNVLPLNQIKFGHRHVS